MTENGRTLPQSAACHLAHGAWLQVRTLDSDGAGVRQAASLTFMVSVAEISCLQDSSRVCTPSPHVTLHGLQSPYIHLCEKPPAGHKLVSNNRAIWQRCTSFLKK
jgi:hypothetical protein